MYLVVVVKRCSLALKASNRPPTSNAPASADIWECASSFYRIVAIVLIFQSPAIGSIITIDLPHSCHPGLVADRISLHLTSCALLATIASLSYLPMIPLFATIVIVCYHLVFPSPEKSGESPAWGTWGSASAIEKGDVDSVLDGK
ncbi:hypothetical protein F5887DRAFT_989577 [Amanita rubescens]|nr:hypothetical protein F5887DRAFT_989577 [Amanita rubescens]